VWLLPVFVAGGARAADDAAIYALIDTLKPVAEAITIDGDPADWGAIPAFADPSGDGAGLLAWLAQRRARRRRQ